MAALVMVISRLLGVVAIIGSLGSARNQKLNRNFARATSLAYYF